MKVLTIVGARPQFVKAAAVSHVLRRENTEVLVHTGQHYDYQMSEVFFQELAIPAPDYNLEVGSSGHSVQTGEMLIRLEPIVQTEKPDCMLVYGDTNSTLAGALVGSKLHVPVAHVEAGLRSFNRKMPEEINRVLTDHVSQLLFCPAEEAVNNLKVEGIHRGVHVVGDVMQDMTLRYIPVAQEKSGILQSLQLESGNYILATLHRPATVDDPKRLSDILETFGMLGETIVFPIHPRTRKAIEAAGVTVAKNITLISPVGYVDMLWLEKNARMILTDSGGIQKEAYWVGAPCLTLREETEWVETVHAGWNRVVGLERSRILDAVKHFDLPVERPPLFGDGNASQVIVQYLMNEF